MERAREKIKVKIANQVLSNSVTDTLVFLSKDLKLPQFQRSMTFLTFLIPEIIGQNIFSSGHSQKKFEQFSIFLNEMIEYINLKLGNLQIIQSSQKTGFLGFLIFINSLKYLNRWSKKKVQLHINQ